jgi:hypothetical protein
VPVRFLWWVLVFLVRLPVTAIGFTLVLTLATPIMGIMALFWLFVEVVFLPFAILGAVFANKPGDIKDVLPTGSASKACVAALFDMYRYLFQWALVIENT